MWFAYIYTLSSHKMVLLNKIIKKRLSHFLSYNHAQWNDVIYGSFSVVVANNRVTVYVCEVDMWHAFWTLLSET